MYLYVCVCVRILSGDDVGGVPKPPKQPVSLAEFLDRKLVKTAAKTIKVAACFCFVRNHNSCNEAKICSFWLMNWLLPL